MKVWVSSRAARLNEQDHVDFDAFAEQAIANGGDAYINGFYHAHVFLRESKPLVQNDVVLITAFSEEQ